MDWQPIETAPKDGTCLLLYVPEWKYESGGWDDHMQIGYYRPWVKMWLIVDPDCANRDEIMASVAPSHWVRLPAPPFAP